MLFVTAEVDVQRMKRGKQLAEGRTLRHDGKRIHVLREALAAVAVSSIGARHVGMGIVDVAGEQHAGVDAGPVGTHAAAVVADGVEVGNLVGAEDVVGILGYLGLKRGHADKLLALEDAGQEVDFAREHHRLLLEVFDMGALRKELRHEVDLVAGLLRKLVGGSRQDRSSHEDRLVGQVGDELAHQGEILSAVVFRRNVNLKEVDVGPGYVVVHTLGRIAYDDLNVLIVLFEPSLEGAADEAAPYYANSNHLRSPAGRSSEVDADGLELLGVKRVDGVDLDRHAFLDLDAGGGEPLAPLGLHVSAACSGRIAAFRVLDG